MNNNLTTERAVRDVFSTASYVTLGDKDKPLPYGLMQKERSCYYTKQFLTNPPKMGIMGSKLPDVYLERKHMWVSEGDTYKDKIWYKDQQKEKKKGFLTGDFKRRDEFSLNFTTEQYREQLVSENKFNKDRLSTLQAQSDAYKAKKGTEDVVVAKPAAPLYDLVYDGDEPYPTAVKNSMSAGRDTQNPTQLTWGREYGKMTTSSMEIGYGVDAEPHDKPQFARVPIVRSTFYRRKNIPVQSTLYTKPPSAFGL